MAVIAAETFGLTRVRQVSASQQTTNLSFLALEHESSACATLLFGASALCCFVCLLVGVL